MTSPSSHTHSGSSSPHHTTITNLLPTRRQTEGTSTINDLKETKKEKQKNKTKTYNSRCSPVVTHLTTNLPVSGLSMGEQTGPRIFHYLWSYVLESRAYSVYIDASFS
ncbi:hypothetical protein V8C44DRAFT_206803 [Trichoderma aethiopicum]